MRMIGDSVLVSTFLVCALCVACHVEVRADPFAESAAARMTRRYGLHFSATGMPGFYVLSSGGVADRVRLARRLAHFHDRIYSRFFPKKRIATLTVVVFPDAQTYWKKTKMDGIYGHYEPSERALFTYRQSGIGTFFHEVVHHYLHENYGDRIPDWFDEGVASFFEMLGILGDRYYLGYTNWRLPILKRGLKRGKYVPIRRFLAQYQIKSSVGLAQARHLMVYLYASGVLERLTRSYGQILHKHRTAQQLVESLTNCSLEELDRRFKQAVAGWRERQEVPRVGHPRSS